MTRRTVAGLLAIGLIAVGVMLAAREPAPFVTFRPGPTLNVLGEYDGKKIISVTGHKTYEDDGALRLVTVYLTGPRDEISLPDALWSWADRDVAVLPKSAVYAPEETNKSARQASAAEMTSSQDNATAAALGALDIKYRTDVTVADVAKGGAADGILKTGDVLRTVNGKPAADSAAFIAALQPVKPGTAVSLGIRRGSTEREVTVTTRPSAEDKAKSRINVSIGQKLVFPFKVEIRLGENIGGPSAGMMFALSIYDLLTPGSLTGGEVIAGSGEISADGIVGPIGGIGQKLVGAQADGAKLFLVAEENCAEAAKAHYDKDTMQLVKVHTLADAIKDVTAWRENPEADLPGCG